MIEKLLNFSENLEESFAEYLSANDLPAYTSSHTGKIPDSAIVISVQPGPADGQSAPKTTTGTGFSEYDRYSAVLEIGVRTDKYKGDEPLIEGFKTYHSQRLGLLKKYLLKGYLSGKVPGQTVFLNSDYYSLFEILPQGENTSVDNMGRKETLLVYSIKFQIKPDSWPTD